jgi:hypothetical protein
MKKVAGVAVQGDFAAHGAALEGGGAETVAGHGPAPQMQCEGGR